MKKAFNALLKALVAAEDTVCCICSSAMILLVFFTVILRYIFKTSIIGLEELIMLFAFGVYFIGASLGSRDETEITADLMSLFIRKPKGQAILRAYQRLANAILMGICAIFSWQQFQFVLENNSKTTGLKLPMGAYYILIAIGVSLVAFYSLYHFIENIIILSSTKKNEPEEKE